MKDGRLKRYRKGSNNSDKTGHSKTKKENSTSKYVENAQKLTNNQMQRKQNNFGAKYGNGENITEKPNR